MYKTLVFGFTKVYKSGPLLAFLLVLITIAHGLTPTATVYIGKLLLNAVIDILDSPTETDKLHSFLSILTLQAMVLVLVNLINHANSYISYLLGKRLSLNMNAEILTKASKLDYSWFENSRFYDNFNRAQAESNGKPLTLLFKISFIISGTITFFSMGWLIISCQPTLFILMLILCFPLILIQIKYGRKNYHLQYNRTEDMRMAGYVSGIMTNRQYIPEILGFGLCKYLFDKWNNAAKKFYKQDTKLQKNRTIAELLAGILMAVSSVVITGYIVYLNISKNLSLRAGDIIMYTAAFTGGLNGLKVVSEGISGIYEHSLFLNNLLEFNKIKSCIEVPDKGKQIPDKIHSIALENVSFKYPGSSNFVLQNINLTFRKSESTLIVGANGAGKTTLIKLLLRLYDPTEGRILLNGTDIREFKINCFRKTIGVIFQEFIRYAFTLKENIGCGCVDDIENNQRIINSAKRAKADNFIDNMPRKYKTIVSKLFQDGQELSVGQWQRICLARLFMKNAPILIFDEPTASLDIETEAHLLQEIAQLSKDNICIVVSHRFFRKGITNQIVVMEKGAIIEKGGFEYLIAKNREFSRLFKLDSRAI